MSELSFPVLPVAPHPDYRAGIIAVVGRTNAGKSTLVNRLVGEKFSIVSPVVQTTRHVIRGIHSESRGQLVFLDTPGLHKAEGELGKAMNRMARSSVGGCDLVMLVLDGAAMPCDEDKGWIKRLMQEQIPVMAVINKTDLGDKGHAAIHALWQQLADEAGPLPAPWTWATVAAETGDGCEALLSCLFERIPPGPPLFPEDILSDYPRKLAVADVIREKLFGVLYDELPHEVAVWVEDIKDEGETLEIGAVVYVNKHSQKGIVIGDKGRVLRRVNRSATRELEAIYEKPVKLQMWVKVEKNWSRNFWLMKKLGYVG